jgi:ACT domain-containing protein
MNYLLSKVQVKDVMTRNVLTVNVDTPIEEAARIMVDNKIGGLPVLRQGELVGIITETDLFKIFLELMGARQAGVRITALISDQRGQLARLTRAIAEAGGSFIAFGQFSGEVPDTRLVTFKVTEISAEAARQAVEPVVIRLIDVRTCALFQNYLSERISWILLSPWILKQRALMPKKTPLSRLAPSAFAAAAWRMNGAHWSTLASGSPLSSPN